MPSVIMADDPASLARLQDIVLPAPIEWWPLAPGWYLIALVALALTFWISLHLWRTHQSSAYRRAALSELRRIEQAWYRRPGSGSSLSRDLAELLRRTALAAAPRASVAPLSGAAWRQFLNDSLAFSKSQGTWDWLDHAYRPAEPVTQRDGQAWISATRNWIRNHRTNDPC